MPKGIYIKTEEHKKKLQKSSKKAMNRPEIKEKMRKIALDKGYIPPSQKGKKRSKDTRKKMSYHRKKMIGEKNPRWEGGKIQYIHRRAWELFGQDKCEVCGMTNDDHIRKCGHRLSMHCDNHRYKNIERIFWTTCCEFGCHQKLEMI